MSTQHPLTAPSSPQEAITIDHSSSKPLSLGSSHNYNLQRANLGHIRSRSDSNPHPGGTNSVLLVNPFDQFPTSNTTTTSPTNPPSIPSLTSNYAIMAPIQTDWQTNQSLTSAALALSPRNAFQQQPVRSIPVPTDSISRASSDPPVATSTNNPFAAMATNASPSTYSQIHIPVSESKEELALQNQIKAMELKREEAEQSENMSNSSSFLNLPSFTKIFTPLRSGSEANHKDELTDSGAMIMMSDDQRDDITSNDYDKSVIICGYLYKRTRNGSWQKRFFETNGQTLTYFKSRKRTKKLAELDLYKVGSIGIDSAEPTGSTFIIQVKNRPYHLKAENRDYAQDWVIQLNLVREARFGIGGMKLSIGPDAGTELTTNRQRSHGLRAEDKNIMFQEVDIPVSSNPLETGSIVQLNFGESPYTQPQDVEGGQELFTDWKKRGGRLRVIRYKLVRWARKIHIAGICTSDKNDVVVPQNTPRPGDSSDGGDTSVGGSDVTSGSQNQTSSATGAAASGSSSIMSVLKGVNLSPKRQDVEFVGIVERDTPTPTFHMA